MCLMLHPDAVRKKQAISLRKIAQVQAETFDSMIGKCVVLMHWRKTGISLIAEMSFTLQLKIIVEWDLPLFGSENHFATN